MLVGSYGHLFPLHVVCVVIASIRAFGTLGLGSSLATLSLGECSHPLSEVESKQDDALQAREEPIPRCV